MIPIWTHFILILSSVIFLIKLIHEVKQFAALIGTSLLVLWSSWQLTIVTRNRLRNKLVDTKGKAVLITGCDSGFGNTLAWRLNKCGFTVYAACLYPNGENALELKASATLPDKIHIIPMNVTRDEDVNSALEEVRQSLDTNNEELWALVNNAGVITSGEVEWGNLDGYKNIIEVNVMGMIRVTRAFVPLIRHCRGRIINMGSVAGRFTAPGLTAYSMSKHAVIAFTDGLRREMRKWDVKVIGVEPDAYKTPMVTEITMMRNLENCWLQTSADTRSDYGQSYFETFKKYMQHNLDSARNYPEEVVSAMIDAVASAEPEMRYLCCGPHNRVIIWFFDILPIQWLEPIVNLFIVRQRPMSYTISAKRGRSKNGLRCRSGRCL